MTKEQFASIKLYIDGAYNNFQISALVWYDMLKDYDYKTCFEAVKNVIKVAKYPLTIAAVVEEYNSLIKKQLRSDMEYLLSIANEMYDKSLISDEIFDDIEYQINYEDYISEKNKQILLAYKKKDNRLLEIFKEKEKQLCLE